MLSGGFKALNADGQSSNQSKRRGGFALKPVALSGLLLASLAGRSGAQDAQIVIFYPHSGEIETVAPETLKRTDPVTEKVAAKSVTWNLTYQDVVTNSGKGFDGPNGAQARAAIAAVLNYIGSVLGDPGSADIEFRVSQTDGTGYLAISGCYFYFSGVGGGFSGGFVHDHIINGTDPSASSPFDGNSIFDFGFNYHFDHTTPCPADKLDFFSVALHELTHTLGFLTLTASNGASTIGSDRRSMLDQFVETGNGKDLFANGGQGAFLGSSSDLVGAAGGVVLDIPQAISAYGSAPRLYAPNPFISSTSLSHFDYSVTGAVMHPNIGVGVMKRAYSLVEQATLAGLGFGVSTGPTPAPTISLTPTPSPSPTPACGETIYRQDFETGLGDWYFSGGQQGMWHVTAACRSALAGHSGANALAYSQDAGCTYDNGATHFGYVYSPTIDLTGVAPPIMLSFNYFLQTEADAVFDMARMEASIIDLPEYTTLAVNNGGNLADPSGEWREQTADLSAFAGQRIRLRLTFASGDNQANAFAGWFVDDVTVCSGIAAPTISPTPSASYSPTPAPAPPNHASLYLMGVPATMRTNQEAQALIILRNTGTTAWTAAGGYALGVVSDSCGLFHSPRLYFDPQLAIAPGQVCAFSAAIQAPPSAGSCAVELRMVQEFVEFFGETIQASVEVSVPPPVDAELVSQSIPKALASGQTVQFSITMRNTGTTPWSAAAGFSLAVKLDTCGLVESSDGRLRLPEAASVAPGETHAFEGTMALHLLGGEPPPLQSAAGDCMIEFQMIQEPGQFFGATAQKFVDITNAAGEWAGYD